MTTVAQAERTLARRVLVASPTLRDAEVTSDAFGRVGIESLACQDLRALSREIDIGVGAILMTDDAFNAPGIDAVTASLSMQPRWSRPPVVLLANASSVSSAGAAILRKLENVTMLERPAPMRSVISAVQTALRAREHQYLIRDQIEALEEAQRLSNQLQKRLELAIAAADLGTFHSDAPFDRILSTDRCRAHFWLPPGASVDFDLFYSRIHQEDRERARRAIGDCMIHGTPCDVDFRTVSPSGASRWIRATGRTSFGDNGKALKFDGTTQDITERKRRENELRESDRRKDEFLATLAHELRNPLAPIRNGVEILTKVGLDEAQVPAVRAMMERQLQQMVRLVDDLIDVSRITRGKLRLRRQPVELSAVVSLAVEISQPVIERHHHQLILSLPPESVKVDGDPARLGQALANLLINAAKFSGERNRIELRASRQNGEIVVRVRDYGIGIAADMLPRVFEMFAQADHPPGRGEGGLGIGLSLVKALVKMHGGAVEAFSDGPGKGSEFVVRLPILPEHLPDVPAPAEAPEDSSTTGTFHARRVLIVDDNKDAAITLGMIVEMEGHDVRTAYDAKSALELAKEHAPDAVLLDIGLPGTNGYELAQQIRSLPALDNVLLVAVTGFGQEEDRRRARQAGFNAHLVKPVEPGVLKALLARR